MQTSRHNACSPATTRPATTRPATTRPAITRPATQNLALPAISEEEYIRAGICPMCQHQLHFTGGCSFCHCCGWSACEG